MLRRDNLIFGKLKIMRKITFFLIFILFIFWPNFIYAQNLRIHFIDAGEGESILIETP